jgi:serine/threonine-protein kinase
MVCLDSAGNIYISIGTADTRMLKLPAGSNTPMMLPFSGLSLPDGVAVDTAGDVYVADSGHNRVVKLWAHR